MTTEQEKTLAFLESICKDADEKRRAGDWSGMERIKKDTVLQWYFNNVYKLGVSPAAFAAQPMFRHAVTLREEYDAQVQQAEQVTENDTRISALEEKLDKLIGIMTPFIESVSEKVEDEKDEEQPEPETKPRRKKKAEKPQEEAEPPAEDAAEGEDSEAE